MELLTRFYNMTMAVVDLVGQSAEVLPLPDNLLMEHLGGAAINKSLFEYYRDDDPLILGVGPLTGSFAPSSALLVATFRAFESGDLCHTPLLLRAGPELKFSGFDFVIIKGKSPVLQALFVSDGAIQPRPAGDLLGVHVPQVTQALRRQVPASHRCTILTGPAADRLVPYATVSTGMCGSLDKRGLANWMASRNLKAILVNGTGTLPFPENNFARGEKMMAGMASTYPAKNKGSLAVLERLAPGIGLKSMLQKSMIKNLACYHCPFPCMSYIKMPALARRQRKTAEGFVLMDHVGFLALARKRGSEALVLMKECLHLGLDPVAAAAMLPPEGSVDSALEIIREVAGVKESRDAVQELGNRQKTGELLGGDIPLKTYRLFGGGIPAIVTDSGGNGAGDWARRVATAMILGICPLVLLLFPHNQAVELLRLVSEEEGDVEFLQQRLNRCVESILSN